MPNDVLSADDLVDDDHDHRLLRSGARLGRYELVMPVARGGMARVWAARLHGERGFSKDVAIKTILGELAADPVFERMFLDEAQIAAAIQHPNVCEVYELGDQDGVLYIAMEWVSGDSLARMLHKRSHGALPIDAAAAVRIVSDTCAGLHAAHELCDNAGNLLNVVHRDISPHNILVTADGIAKVADFGIAKAMNGFRNELTATGQLKGKLSYMSPEYVAGEAITRCTDVFSMGVTLYEATTGLLPFRGDNEGQMLLALMDNQVVRPSSFVHGYSRDLEAIVLRAIAHRPADRYPSAEAMRYALEEWLARNASSGTHNLVAEIMRARVGGDIDDRRDRVREAVRRLPARVGSGTLPPPSSSTWPLPVVPPSWPHWQEASPLSESRPVDSIGAIAMRRPLSAPPPPPLLARLPARIGLGVATIALLSSLGALALHRLLQPAQAVAPSAAAQTLVAPPPPVVVLPPPATVAATAAALDAGVSPPVDLELDPATVTTPEMLPSAAPTSRNGAHPGVSRSAGASGQSLRPRRGLTARSFRPRARRSA